MTCTFSIPATAYTQQDVDSAKAIAKSQAPSRRSEESDADLNAWRL